MSILQILEENAAPETVSVGRGNFALPLQIPVTGVRVEERKGYFMLMCEYEHEGMKCEKPFAQVRVSSSVILVRFTGGSGKNKWWSKRALELGKHSYAPTFGKVVKAINDLCV